MPRSRHVVAALLAFAIFVGALPRAVAQTPFYTARIHGLILPGTTRHIRDVLETADEDGASLVVIELNTPGGMLLATQEIVELLLKSPVPVAVYVSPSGGTAASAGVFVTLAGHIAAMAPGTSIGAAHPVDLAGGNVEGDMRKKVENIATAMIKSIALYRGRNVEWAEQAVRESVSLTDREAVEKNVVDLTALSLDDLLAQIAGRKITAGGKEIELPDLRRAGRHEMEMSFQDRAINVLSHPAVLAILWLVASVGIMMELYTPGAVLPGLLGVVALLVALAMSQIIPINVSGVLLLIVGVAFIAAELFIPSGAFGFVGIVAIAFGALYLVDMDFSLGVMPDSATIASLGACAGLLVFGLVWALLRTKKYGYVSGAEGLVGQIGEVIDPVSTQGRVLVNGEFWNATAGSGLLPAKTRVKVVGVKGLVLEVKALEHA